MINIFRHLETNLKEIYHKAVDADESINALKKQGMAKFSQIFPEQSLFNINDNRFTPYVTELSEDIEAFKQQPNDQAALTLILKKMQQLHNVLAAFKEIT